MAPKGVGGEAEMYPHPPGGQGLGVLGSSLGVDSVGGEALEARAGPLPPCRPQRHGTVAQPPSRMATSRRRGPRRFWSHWEQLARCAE